MTNKKMKKTAKDFMTEERFWKIIERSQKGSKLKIVLMELSKDEIMGYWYWWKYFQYISYKWELWAVASTILNSRKSELFGYLFDHFRFWLVSRGKKVFYDALENPDSLCNEFDNLPNDEYPAQEELDYIPEEVIIEKFDEDFIDLEESYEFNLEEPDVEYDWDEDDEESIRKIIPNTFDKWWKNNVF